MAAGITAHLLRCRTCSDRRSSPAAEADPSVSTRRGAGTQRQLISNDARRTVPTPWVRLLSALVLWALLGARDGLAAQSSSTEPPSDIPAVDLDSTEREAVRLRAGSVADRQIVAIGRDLLIEGDALQSVAVLQGRASIEGSVRGDVVVLGGSVALGSRARVEGDVYALGGAVDVAPGARIAGRVAAYPGAPSTLLLMVEGPALGLGAFSRPVLAAKLAAAFAWLLISLVVLSFGAADALRRTRADLWRNPLQSFFVGLVTLASLLVGIVLLSAFAPPAIGIPTVLALVLLLLALKIWGTVSILDGVGGALLGRWAAPAPSRLAGAVCLAALIKLVPYVGTVVWSAVTLVAVGAALSSRFGRQTEWIP